ncbi:MAG: phenylalanine--tRNA ligase subunit alpha [Candidatus Micrarchaeia archaeon]
MSNFALTWQQVRILEKIPSTPQSARGIGEDAGIDYSTFMSALSALSEQGLVEVSKEERQVYELTAEGKTYLDKGTPERRLYASVAQSGESGMEAAYSKAGLADSEKSVALQWAKKNGWLKIGKSASGLPVFQPAAKPDADALSRTEKILEAISKGASTDIAVADLSLVMSRKLATERTEKEFTVNATSAAQKAIELSKKQLANVISAVTPESIRTKAWKRPGAEFEKYDPLAASPVQYVGKKQPLRSFIDEIRQIFLEMGFTEIKGPIVEAAFWNFDALYVPQDHPGRELQDTFYVKNPGKSVIDAGGDKARVENVKDVHQNGGNTGSVGWGYSWDAEVAKKNVLRTHTTAATCRHLVKAASEGKFPVKVFCIDRVYRNEAIDYKHLAEFHQVEGIIIDDNCTFQDLIGMLRIFYQKLGFTDIRITPSFFPYTEPSAQVEVFDPVRKEWLELGGCGMFRPEVTRPLGITGNVAAWGQGLERLMMSREKLSDIRTLYRNDLDWIRKERKN